MMQRVTLQVQGMSCNHCVQAVEENVGNINGVQSVHVLLEEGKVDVTFDEAKTNVDEIKQTIEEQGYDVTA